MCECIHVLICNHEHLGFLLLFGEFARLQINILDTLGKIRKNERLQKRVTERDRERERKIIEK